MSPKKHPSARAIAELVKLASAGALEFKRIGQHPTPEVIALLKALATPESSRVVISYQTGTSDGDVSDDRSAVNALLTRPEAARLLRISVSTLDRLRAAGQIPAVTIGRHVFYRRADLEKYTEVSTDRRD